MQRTFTAEGFILKTDRMGEIHKRVVLLTYEHALLSVIAHGAYKTTGKLKSHTELFIHGSFSLYHEPVKDSYKITDVECLHAFPSLRRSIVKYFAASLFAEIVLLSYGGGEAGQELFMLFKETFLILDENDEQAVLPLVIQFIIRFLFIIGHDLNLITCAQCSRPLHERESLYFVRRGTSFVCHECKREGNLEMSAGAIQFLLKTLSLPLKEACRVRLSRAAFGLLKNILYLYVQESIEKELATLGAGKGIL